jgi:hypothetical protein
MARLGEGLLQMGSKVLMDFLLLDLEAFDVLEAIDLTREGDDACAGEVGDTALQGLVEADSTLDPASHLVATISQQDERGAGTLRSMETSVKGTPKSSLETSSVGSLGVCLEGLDKTTIELNVTDTSLKELEDKTLDASKRRSFFGRVPREVIREDSVRLVVKRTCKSLLNPLSKNTLTDTGFSPDVESLLLAIEESSQVTLDPIASILRAIKMFVDFIV